MTEETKPMTPSEMGKKGIAVVIEKYGKEHFIKANKLSHLAKKRNKLAKKRAKKLSTDNTLTSVSQCDILKK